MKKRNSANIIILWVVAIGLLVSMVIAFTPNLGRGGLNNTIDSPTVLEVNGNKITELDVARGMRNPPFNIAVQGEMGDDLETLLFDQLINNSLLNSAAAKISVSNNDVREALAEFRESNNLAGRSNDIAYRNAIARSGFSDESFRAYLKERERIEKFRASLTEGVKVSDDQVQQYFELNRDNYLSDPEIIGRYLVVEDEQLANDLREELRSNPEADFATLARDNSIEKAEEGGAIAGSDDALAAAGRAALPSTVANAAFALTDGGITDVVSNAGLYYIVDVEQYLTPEPREFSEVKDDVREAAQAVIEAAALETAIETMRAEATITYPSLEELQKQYGDEYVQQYTYENPVVATVGEKSIYRSDLAQSIYYNPSYQSFLSASAADFIGFLKTQSLQGLIDSELAYQGAKNLDVDFIGQPSDIAQSALQYISKDIETTEDEVAQYYQDNPTEYTDAASAQVQQLIFSGAEGGEDSAQSFQLALLNGDIAVDDIANVIESYQGRVDNLGSIGVTSLPINLQAPVFGSDNKGLESELTPLEGSELSVSPIVPLSADKSNYTFVLADVTPEKLRAFESVKSNAEEKVLQNKKREAQTAWLDELRAEIPVEDLTATEPEVDFDIAAPAEAQEVEPEFTTEPLPVDATPVDESSDTESTPIDSGTDNSAQGNSSEEGNSPESSEEGNTEENTTVVDEDNTSASDTTTPLALPDTTPENSTSSDDAAATPESTGTVATSTVDEAATSVTDNATETTSTESASTASVQTNVETSLGTLSDAEVVGSGTVVEGASSQSNDATQDAGTSNAHNAISNITSQINSATIAVEPTPVEGVENSVVTDTSNAAATNVTDNQSTTTTTTTATTATTTTINNESTASNASTNTEDASEAAPATTPTPTTQESAPVAKPNSSPTSTSGFNNVNNND